MSASFTARLTLLLGTLLLSTSLHGQLTPRTISGLASGNEIEQPLPLEQAFPFYVSAVTPGRYKVVWDLPEGHYLYRHAFDFTLSQETDAEELEVEYVIPPGLKKNDQFFGDIEAYYGHLDVDLTLPTVPSPDARVVIYYQGCADWGFCYPPQRFEFPLNP